jgi:hypothetical protein
LRAKLKIIKTLTKKNKTQKNEDQNKNKKYILQTWIKLWNYKQ